MSINIDELKKKIIYRSNYRGIKELDILLSSFTKSVIDNLNNDDLIDLSILLDEDDDNLYKFHQGLSINSTIKDNKISRLFKEFTFKKK